MSLKDDFKTFCENISLDNIDDMKITTGEIAKKLNSEYYEIDGDKDSHMNIVGSIGRKTAIIGVSDLDLLFELPKDIFKKYDEYESNGQSALLQDIRSVLLTKYPKTKIRGDGQVVVIEFNKYTVELVPGFKQIDNTFKYPDTHDNGTWKITNPLDEQNKCKSENIRTYNNFSIFCNMLRKWKNNIGFKFGGLLIDTLVYNFFNSNTQYNNSSYDEYLKILKELFKYLMNQNSEQEYWLALGSNQHVYNSSYGKFVNKAKKAYNKLDDKDDSNEEINDLLREIFGNDFPDKYSESKQSNHISERNYIDREEFIENSFIVDIKHNLSIDCKVEQNGWRTQFLKFILRNRLPLMKNKNLDFFIVDTDADEPYDIYWKIKNRGKIAKEKDCLRGQIIKTNSSHQREQTNFIGPHYVECYIVKNDICIARNRLDVPISEGT